MGKDILGQCKQTQKCTNFKQGGCQAKAKSTKCETEEHVTTKKIIHNENLTVIKTVTQIINICKQILGSIRKKI